MSEDSSFTALTQTLNTDDNMSSDDFLPTCYRTDASHARGHVTYVWRGLALPQPAVGLPAGLLVSMATGVSLDEGDVVVVGAGGSGQDPHEVTVVAEVLQQTGHPPEHTHNAETVRAASTSTE